jgi:hypothetical protein
MTGTTFRRTGTRVSSGIAAVFALLAALIALAAPANAHPAEKEVFSGRGFTCLFYAEEGHEIVLFMSDNSLFGQTSSIEVWGWGEFESSDGTSSWGANSFEATLPLGPAFESATIRGTFEYTGEVEESEGPPDRSGNSVTVGAWTNRLFAVTFTEISIGNLHVDLAHAANGCDGGESESWSVSNEAASGVSHESDFVTLDCQTSMGHWVNVTPHKDRIEVYLEGQTSGGGTVVPRGGGTSTFTWHNLETGEMTTVPFTLTMERAGQPHTEVFEDEGARFTARVTPWSIELSTQSEDGTPLSASCQAVGLEIFTLMAPA